ncbi:MAG: hypothetical protein N7Q72_03130 [Spiroplasma sp. Tabriz.8]|nr:hypothetical protein [Spiroplasma sp. Tabriz.8]
MCYWSLYFYFRLGWLLVPSHELRATYIYIYIYIYIYFMTMTWTSCV